MAAEALVPPDAGSSRRDSYRDSRRNSVHKCPETAPRGHFHRFVYTPASPRSLATAQQPNSVHKRPNPARRGPILPFVYTIAIPRSLTTQAHGPTVYTNAPKRHREAISTDLCTLLRRRPGGEAHVAGVVTQPPTHTSSRSRQKVPSNLSCRISRALRRFTPTAIDHDQLLPRPLRRQTSRLGMRPSNSRSHPDCRLAPSALAPCVPQSALRLASSLSVEVAPCQN